MSTITFEKDGKKITINTTENAIFTIGGEYGFSVHDKDGNYVPFEIDSDEDVMSNCSKNSIQQIAGRDINNYMEIK